jgi:hypothetical protein
MMMMMMMTTATASNHPNVFTFTLPLSEGPEGGVWEHFNRIALFLLLKNKMFPLPL